MGADEIGTGEHASRRSGFGAAGAELAEARKRKQLSLESVAADLHLRPDIVAAIEAGDEAKLPAAAFVRGYIKSYARLLGVDETALMAQLPDPSRQRAEPLRRVGMRRQRVSLPVGKWLLRGVALFALLLLLVYGVPVFERIWTKEGPEPVADPLLIPPADEEHAAAEHELSAPEEIAAPMPDPVPAEDTALAPAEAVALPAEPAAAAAQPDAQEAVGPAVVHLRFTQDSWVEMEAHGRKLVVGTQRAGSERTVRAEPPVSVLLGNAPGVELSYRGKSVDLSPYQRGRVARLTLED